MSVLRWDNITFSADNGKTLLHGLSGVAQPGKLLAVMGSSGSGKTLLLRCLSGRLKPSGGSVLVGNQSVNLKYAVTLVPQQEYMLGSLRVEHVVKYGTKLVTSDSEEVKKRTDRVIDAMGLRAVRKTRVGTPILKGCSGGERRRVAIAKELVAEKSIILADAPTRGLDSAAAFQVISYLKNLAIRENVTIVTSVDQPPSATFGLFDQVYLLSYGTLVYSGEVSNLAPHFSSLGHPPPQHVNIADHCLSLVNGDFHKDPVQGKQIVLAFATKSRQLLAASPKGDVHSPQQATSSNVVTGEGQYHSGSGVVQTSKPTSFIHQVLVLMQRGFLNATLNPIMYWVRVAMYMAMGIMMGFVWFQIGNEATSVQQRMNGHYYAVAFLCFMMVAGIPSLLEEKGVFDLEHSAGLYSPGAYVLATTLVSLPFLALMSLAFLAIAYPLIGLNPGADHFFTYLAILFSSLFCAESIVLLITAIIPIFVAALTITAFMNGFFMILEGYFIVKDDIPKPWLWGHYWSYQKYAFEAVVKNDFEGEEFGCTQDSVCGCVCEFHDSLLSQCKFQGESVLSRFEYEDVPIWGWVVILLAMGIVYRIFMVMWLTWGSAIIKKCLKCCRKRDKIQDAPPHSPAPVDSHPMVHPLPADTVPPTADEHSQV